LQRAEYEAEQRRLQLLYDWGNFEDELAAKSFEVEAGEAARRKAEVDAVEDERKREAEWKKALKLAEHKARDRDIRAMQVTVVAGLEQ
jgi:hypothetical protein